MHEVGRTAALTGGEVESGVRANRSNTNFPDIEQEKREQARQESAWARGEREDHPLFARVSPERAVAEGLITLPDTDVAVTDTTVVDVPVTDTTVTDTTVVDPVEPVVTDTTTTDTTTTDTVVDPDLFDTTTDTTTTDTVA